LLKKFLSLADADRALRTFRRLGRHDIRRWALTGGLAVEVHHMRRGYQPSVRALNDIDFLADSFDAIPESLADDFQLAFNLKKVYLGTRLVLRRTSKQFSNAYRASLWAVLAGPRESEPLAGQ
jgi:hypothetical protein